MSSSLWMGDLDTYMDELFISGAFQQLGENVLHVKIIKHKNSGSLAGYCFVEFGNADAANRAMLRLNGKTIPGSIPSRRFKLNPASYGKEHIMQKGQSHLSRSRESKMPEFSLFVGDLSSDVDDYQLYNAFARRYRSVRAAKVVLDSSGISKGYGFVRFSEETDQQRALIEMQHMTGIGRKPIRVSLASPKRMSEGSGSYSGSYYPNHGSYYAGSYTWGGYTYNYNQQYPNSSHYPDHAHDYYNQNYDEDMEALEDPCVEVHINKENREFMASSESFFEALERSRWFPVDSVGFQIPAN